MSLTARELRPSECAICRTRGNARQVYAQRLGPTAFAAATFSARRRPDRIHYRIVRCRGCGLVRSDPVAGPELLAHVYRQSTFSYGDQVASLRRTYGWYLDELQRFGVAKGSLLEIGCGNGFFLESALDAGYRLVRGIEPSTEAVARSDPRIRPAIVCDSMRPGLFPPGTFDVICLFQVLDHLPDPGAVLDECRRLLRPGGYVLCLNHNVEALSARILSEWSPIIDVEHTYLYDPRTIRRLFEDRGFQVRRVGPAFNTYRLPYLLWLTPLPGWWKAPLLALARFGPLRDWQLTLPLGNLYLIAMRPGPTSPEV